MAWLLGLPERGSWGLEVGLDVAGGDWLGTLVVIVGDGLVLVDLGLRSWGLWLLLRCGMWDVVRVWGVGGMTWWYG